MCQTSMPAPEGTAFVFAIVKNTTMEKRVLGILLSLLGIVGLITAAFNFMNGGGGAHNVKAIVIYSVLGCLFFFAGISLIRNTRDKPS